jgi:hypothetical protein
MPHDLRPVPAQLPTREGRARRGCARGRRTGEMRRRELPRGSDDGGSASGAARSVSPRSWVLRCSGLSEQRVSGPPPHRSALGGRPSRARQSRRGVRCAPRSVASGRAADPRQGLDRVTVPARGRNSVRSRPFGVAFPRGSRRIRSASRDDHGATYSRRARQIS